MYSCIIVEDEKNIRERLKHHFPWQQFQIEIVGEAENGLQAMELIKHLKPNLVFTDIKMPQMDGLQLAKELAELYPQIITIVISAHNDFNFAQKAIEHNVKGYLLKPVLKNDFMQLMERIYKDLQTHTTESESVILTQAVIEENKYVEFAKKYVLDHYRDPISLKDIADHLYISEAYFSNLFSHVTGSAFTVYLNDVRIEKAKELIKYTNESLNEISISVGFNSHSYFNRVFKSKVGVSPLEFRKFSRGRASNV